MIPVHGQLTETQGGNKGRKRYHRGTPAPGPRRPPRGRGRRRGGRSAQRLLPLALLLLLLRRLLLILFRLRRRKRLLNGVQPTRHILDGRVPRREAHAEPGGESAPGALPRRHHSPENLSHGPKAPPFPAARRVWGDRSVPPVAERNPSGWNGFGFCGEVV